MSNDQQNSKDPSSHKQGTTTKDKQRQSNEKTVELVRESMGEYPNKYTEYNYSDSNRLTVFDFDDTDAETTPLNTSARVTPKAPSKSSSTPNVQVDHDQVDQSKSKENSPAHVTSKSPSAVDIAQSTEEMTTLEFQPPVTFVTSSEDSPTEPKLSSKRISPSCVQSTQTSILSRPTFYEVILDTISGQESLPCNFCDQSSIQEEGSLFQSMLSIIDDIVDSIFGKT